ncbi:MAG: tetratricopeptide repeat protein [Chloroflexota bacterium]
MAKAKPAGLSFEKTVEQALKQYRKPKLLGEQSPLAAPYILGNYLKSDQINLDSTNTTQRGHILQEILRDAIDEMTDNIHRDILRMRFVEGKKAAVVIDLSPYEKAQYYEHQKQSIRELAAIVIKHIRPALRLETTHAIQDLVEREKLSQLCLDRLQMQLQKKWQTVALTGLGGSGKTTLGNHLAGRWQEIYKHKNHVFWFTIYPNLTDQLGTLLFNLGYFLHQQGVSTLWQELVATGGQVEFNFLSNLISHDLSQLGPEMPLLCIDEVDMLDPAQRGDHAQMITFLNSLQGMAPILYMGQQVTLAADAYHEVRGLSSSAIRQMLERHNIQLNADNHTRLADYTQGNPRMLELFISITDTGESTEALLDELSLMTSLEFLFTRIVQRLSEAERSILLQISVFPTPAPSDVWQQKETIIAFNQLVRRRLIQDDGRGGVGLLPAYRQMIVANLGDYEKLSQLHQNAADIRQQRGQYTDAMYHLIEADNPDQAIGLWHEYQPTEINQGQGMKALTILRPLKNKNLTRKVRDMLDCACARLDQLHGDTPRALSDLQSMIRQTPVVPSAATVEANEIIGSIQIDLHDFEAARNAYQQAMQTADMLVEGRLAHIHKGIAWSYLREKAIDRAWHEADLADYEVKYFRGAVKLRNNEYEEAIEYFLSALEIAQRLDYTEAIAKTCNGLSVLYGYLGQFDNAQVYYDQAKAGYQQIGKFTSIIGCDTNHANQLNLAGDHAQASKLAQQVLSQLRAVNYPTGENIAIQILAEAKLGLGNLDEAEGLVNTILESEDPRLIPEALRTHGEILLHGGKLDLAAIRLRDAIGWTEQYEDPYLGGYAWRAMGQLHQVQGNHAEAQTAFGTAIEKFEAIQLPYEIEKTRRLSKHEVVD